MSLEYDNRFQSGTVTCDGLCDGCEGQITFDGDFQSVIDQIRAMGWKSASTNDGWMYTCQVCSL